MGASFRKFPKRKIYETICFDNPTLLHARDLHRWLPVSGKRMKFWSLVTLGFCLPRHMAYFKIVLRLKLVTNEPIGIPWKSKQFRKQTPGNAIENRGLHFISGQWPNQEQISVFCYLQCTACISADYVKPPLIRSHTVLLTWIGSLADNSCFKKNVCPLILSIRKYKYGNIHTITGDIITANRNPSLIWISSSATTKVWSPVVHILRV